MFHVRFRGGDEVRDQIATFFQLRINRGKCIVNRIAFHNQRVEHHNQENDDNSENNSADQHFTFLSVTELWKGSPSNAHPSDD